MTTQTRPHPYGAARQFPEMIRPDNDSAIGKEGESYSGGLAFVEPNGICILLAEDEAMVRNLVGTMLSREGYSVLSANDGQEALELCTSFKAPIHMLLTDVTMPRMTGLELAERVLKKRSDIKIMVMSGETVETILKENALDAFLQKPFAPPALLRCVQRLLSSDFKGICYESDLM